MASSVAVESSPAPGGAEQEQQEHHQEGQGQGQEKEQDQKEKEKEEEQEALDLDLGLEQVDLGHADGPVTPEEEKQLEELAELIKEDLLEAPSRDFPEITGRWAQLRFLRGHSWNVEEAAKWFKDGLAWRKKHNVDELHLKLKQILQEQETKYEAQLQQFQTLNSAAADSANPPPGSPRAGLNGQTGVSGGHPLYSHAFLPHADRVLLHYPERFFHKTDRRGNPVMITAQPFINDMEGLMKGLSAPEYLDFQIARSEWRAILLHRLSLEQNRLVQVCYIWDLKDLSFKYWKKISSKEFKAYGGLYTGDHFYPEIASRILALNMPWFLNLAFKALKPMLGARTLAKVRVWGAGYAKQLNQEIDLANIPSTMQGSCNCVDGCFPNNWKTIQIPRGAAEEILLNLERKSLVSWEFQCRGHSIGFQVEEALSQTPHNFSVVLENVRHESQFVCRGQRTCTAGSTLRLTFDNKFSWMRGKTVQYNISSFTVDEEEELETCSLNGEAATGEAGEETGEAGGEAGEETGEGEGEEEGVKQKE